jgi:hypothetical protein
MTAKPEPDSGVALNLVLSAIALGTGIAATIIVLLLLVRTIN